MNEQPPLKELINYATTSEWFKLGIQLELNIVNLNGCNGDLSRVYHLWLQEKGDNATRQKLLSSLKAIHQNNVAYRYLCYIRSLLR